MSLFFHKFLFGMAQLIFKDYYVSDIFSDNLPAKELIIRWVTYLF